MNEQTPSFPPADAFVAKVKEIFPIILTVLAFLGNVLSELFDEAYKTFTVWYITSGREKFVELRGEARKRLSEVLFSLATRLA